MLRIILSRTSIKRSENRRLALELKAVMFIVKALNRF